MTTVASKQNLGLLASLTLVGVVGILVAAVALPEGIDWRHTYCPATRQLWAGQSPYDDVPFYSPPWAALPLLPLALLPVQVGRGAVFVLSLVVYAAVAVKFGARPFSVGLLLLSPIVMHGLLNANIDWVPLLGVFLPARWGLFLAVIKPQVGIGLVVWWAAEAWRDAGWRGVVATFSPVILATALSFVFYGLWPLYAQETSEYWYSASLFPYSVPVGIALLVWALHARNVRPALAASPMLAPYTLFHSWIGALLVLSGNTRRMAIAVAALWGLTIFVATRVY